MDHRSSSPTPQGPEQRPLLGLRGEGATCTIPGILTTVTLTTGLGWVTEGAGRDRVTAEDACQIMLTTATVYRVPTG